MNLATGNAYSSFVYLLEELTRPPEPDRREVHRGR